MEGAPVYAEVELTASGTATLFAAPGADYRTHITKGFITVPTAVAAMQISIRELLTTGTSTAVQTWEVPRAVAGFYAFDLGDHGVPSSQKNSRWIFQVSGADGSATAVFTGYTR